MAAMIPLLILLSAPVPPIPRVLYRVGTLAGTEFRIGQGGPKASDPVALRVAKRYNGLKSSYALYDPVRKAGWTWFYEGYRGDEGQTAWASAQGRPIRVEKGNKNTPEFARTATGWIAMITTNGIGGAVYVAERSRPVKLLTVPKTNSPFWGAAVETVPGGWIFSSSLVNTTYLLRVGRSPVKVGPEVQSLSLRAGYAVVNKADEKPHIVRCRYMGGKLSLGEKVAVAPSRVSTWHWWANRYLVGNISVAVEGGSRTQAMIWDSRTRKWGLLDEGSNMSGPYPWTPKIADGRLVLTTNRPDKKVSLLVIGEVDLARVRFGPAEGLLKRAQQPPFSRTTTFPQKDGVALLLDGDSVPY